MPMMRKTLLVPSNVINDITQLLETVNPTPPEVHARPEHQLQETFQNSYVFTVALQWAPDAGRYVLATSLRNQRDELVDTANYSEGPVDAKYDLHHEDDGYELTVMRAATTTLDAASEARFVSQGNCPFCGSAELTTLSPGPDGEGKLIVPYECANCEARWQAVYNLTGINNDPATITPPRVDVVSNQ